MNCEMQTMSRVLAVQILYSNQLSGDTELNNLIQLILYDYNSESKVDYNNDLLVKLLTYNSENESASHELISKHLKSTWNIERLDRILYVNILLAIAEMSYVEKNDMNKNIILNEYTTIAHMFSDEKETKFINSILQNIWNSFKKFD